MLPEGQYAAGWVGLFLFIALGRMVTFCKEGGGMISVWALRACSYKTKAEAWQQGIALHPPQGVFLVFVLLPVRGERREGFKEFNGSSGSRVQGFKGSALSYPSFLPADTGFSLVTNTICAAMSSAVIRQEEMPRRL